MSDKYIKDKTLLTWIENMKKHCSDNESFMHALSLANSVYGIQTSNLAKYRDSKGNHCNTTYMDEFVTENSSCIGKRCSDDNS